MATTRLCPRCMVHEGVRSGTAEIPKTALETPNLLFSIVGVSGSGKTNYITIMLDALMKFSDLKLAMGDQTDETRDLQKRNMGEMMNGIVPEGNVSGIPVSQIWYIKNLIQKKSGWFSSVVPTYTFTVYDGAGEDHKNMDPYMVRYIKSSEAFIVVLDPLTLEGVRKFVDPAAVRNSFTEGQTDSTTPSNAIVQRLADTLINIKGLKTGSVLKMPIAVVLTKFDTVRDHPAFNNAKVKDSTSLIENGKVREEDFEQIHSEIENWLIKIGEESFINALNGSFAKMKNGKVKTRYYNFFAVSAYGQTPEEAGTVPDKIVPHRVLDPVLWLFKKKKFID